MLVPDGIGLGAPAPMSSAPPAPPGLTDMPPQVAPPTQALPDQSQAAPQANPPPIISNIGYSPAPQPQQPQEPPGVQMPPVDVPTSLAEVAKSNALYDKRQQKQAAYAASADGQLATANQKQADADQQAYRGIQQASAVEVAKANDIARQQQVYTDQQAKLDADRKAFDTEAAKVRQQKQAYVDSSLKDVDNFKIDPYKEWNAAGTANHVGWFIAMALSGLGDALQGKSGPNPVIQMLQEKQQQSIRMQMDQRDQLKDKYGRAEHALDKYDAFSQSRDAQYELLSARSDKWLAQQIALTSSKYAAPEAQARGQQMVAQLLQSSADHAQKSGEFAVNKEIHQKGMDLTRRGQDISAGNEAANRAQALAFHKDDMGYKDAELAEKAAMEQAKLDAKNKGQLSPEESKFAVSAPVDGGAPTVLRNKDGSVWTGRNDPTIQGKTSSLIAAAASYNRLTGDMQRLIADHGGEADFLKSPAWQKMKSKMDESIGELHEAYDIKRFGDSTVDFFKGISTAGIDPTSFIHDASSALQSSADDLQARVNDKLQTDNYTGAPVKFPSFGVPSPSDDTDADRATKTLSQNPMTEAQDSLNPADLEYLHQRVRPDMITSNSGVANGPVVARAKAAGVAPMHLAAFDALAVTVETGDPRQAAQARSAILEQANHGRTAGIRQYAQNLLSSIMARSMDTYRSPSADTDSY